MSAETPAPMDPRGSGLETSALLARLPGVSALDLTVVETHPLTPAMRRLVWQADELERFTCEPGQDVMVAVPATGAQHFRRRYSVRRHDPAAGTLTMDVVLHGDGPGARWAAALQPGDRVEALGPRGKITPVPDVDWHLFIGDESSLPATFAMVESLPATVHARCVIEVGGPEEEQAPDPVRCDLELTFLHRAGSPGSGTALADACRTLHLPAGPGHAYCNGELRQVAAARAVLMERGLAPDAVDHKAYWRLGVANASHGEPHRP